MSLNVNKSSISQYLASLTGKSTKNIPADSTVKSMAHSLKTTDSYEKNYQAKNELAGKALGVFDKLDTNKNGLISKSELNDKLQDRSIKGSEASLTGSMLKYYSEIKKASNDQVLFERGISRKDLIAGDKMLDENGLNSKLKGEYSYRLYKINNVSSLRKDDGAFKIPTKASEVDYRDLEQGQNGNCYFLAVLAAVAHNNPQKIVDMIKDNNDGTYTVKFARKDVTINAPTDTELGLYAEGKSWVPVIEKAYAEYRNQIMAFDNPHTASGRGTIIIGRSIYEITGNTFDSDFLFAHSKDKTREKLTKAFDNNKIVVASIEKEIFKKNDLNLPDAHVYSVLDYDKETDMLTVRNPWGSGEPEKDGVVIDGRNDGIFKMKTDDFYKYFSMLAYEN